MTTNMMTRDVTAQSLHDQVVNLVAQRWARAWQSHITINTDAERARWAESDRSYADVVGWEVKGGQKKIGWIAEVETQDSLAEPATIGRWQDDAAHGVPFFVFIPRGNRKEAEKLALRLGLTLNGLYQYALVNGVLQLS